MVKIIIWDYNTFIMQGSTHFMWFNSTEIVSVDKTVLDFPQDNFLFIGPSPTYRRVRKAEKMIINLMLHNLK